MSVSLDVVVVSFNTAHLLESMFYAVEEASVNVKVNYLIVDNASTDNSAQMLSSFPLSKLIVNDGNVGFGRANNQLLPHLTSEFILLLNTDAFVSKDSLDKSIAFMEKNIDCGILGVKLVGRDGVLQPSCRYFPTPWNLFLARTGLARFFKNYVMVDDMVWAHDEVRECDWVPGCYYLVRREVIDQVGLFDPRFFMYYEEVDHCRRVKAAGWKVCFYPHTSVVHLGGESAKSAGPLSESGRQISALQVESELLYFRKHHGLLGLALHLVLSHVGDAILALKDLIKGRGLRLAIQRFSNSRMVRALCRHTRCAQQATR